MLEDEIEFFFDKMPKRISNMKEWESNAINKRDG
jgi:hypothetical protein